MTRPTCQFAWRPGLRPALALLLALASGLLLPEAVSAQTTRTDPAALRTQIERRYDALPLTDGVALRPRTTIAGVRSVEIKRGSIAIDGQPVTGAELRARLGADADLMLQLSYLDDTQRAALFGPSSGDVPAPVTPPVPPTAQPATPLPPTPPATPRTRRERRDGDRVRFGGSVTVEEGESVTGDVVVIGGSARIDGEVLGDVVVVGGSLRLGPHADISKDAVVVGGALDRDPGARVGGEVEEVGVGPINFDRWRGFRGGPRGGWWRGGFGSAFSLVSTLVRICVLGLLCALVMLFARDYVDRLGARVVAEPIKAGAIGLLAQLLFVPILVVTIVLCVITIVGIPLLLLIPFGILAIMVFALTGFTAVASFAGRWLSQRMGLSQYGPIVTTLVGVILIMSPLVLARLVSVGGGPLWLMAASLAIIGFVVEYVAWTVGLGAVALVRFDRGGVTGEPVAGPMVSGPAV